MFQSLLSVIVPCYNVEKYVDKCISSIVEQTYPNLEIILVDDGSTDNTRMLCDAWQERDSRIRVIHKQNEGSSYARKTGVENATAEYITFVDSDDWIDKNMYSDMMTALLSTNSDIVQCDFCIVHEDGQIEHRVQERNKTVKTMGRVEGVIMVLEDHKWRTSMFTKIFKKKLFKHIEFPKGRAYGEDMIVHNLFHYASKTAFLDKEYYFYLYRSDSVSNRQGDIKKAMKNLSDLSDAYYECYSFVNRYSEYHSVLPQVKFMTICLGISLLGNMINYSQYFSDDCFKAKANQMSSIPIFQGYHLLSFSVKIQLLVFKLNPKLYRILRLFYVRIIHVTDKLKITDKRFN